GERSSSITSLLPVVIDAWSHRLCPPPGKCRDMVRRDIAACSATWADSSRDEEGQELVLKQVVTTKLLPRTDWSSLRLRRRSRRVRYQVSAFEIPPDAKRCR